MAEPITLKRIKPSAGNFYRIFEMYEWEVKFDEDYFHVKMLRADDYHNAYDADEKCVLFRADAIFIHSKGQFEVPVFAAKYRNMKTKAETWKWLIRFRPHFAGRWQLKIYVLHWHTKKASRANPEICKPKKCVTTDKPFYEHEFQARLLDFKVYHMRPDLDGPLEKPTQGENPNYFYRRDANTERKTFFLLGFARPWVTKTSKKISKKRKEPPWDSFLDRETELFEPMAKVGCNVLYHWMSRGETQLVHQAKDEFWFDKKTGFFQGQWTDNKLPDNNKALGYKRFDQGRALRTDEIFEMARKHDVLLFLVVMPHSLFQVKNHNWGEWAWKPEDKKEIEYAKFNGFHFFEISEGKSKSKISVTEFFKMKPGNGSWENQLWKHFANYWRYIIGRWTAHPALGAWVVMDELEGVGNGTSWWWGEIYDEKTNRLTKSDALKKITHKWHDNLIWMIRGAKALKSVKKMKWEWQGKSLSYTSDYLHHPITSSTTHYKGSELSLYVGSKHSKHATKSEKLALEEWNKTGSPQKALQLIDILGEMPDRGTWRGAEKDCHIDFVSHHAYQAVPTWGYWGKSEKSGRGYLKPTKGDIGEPLYALALPNQKRTYRIFPNRWLWDSLCMRLRKWSIGNRKVKPSLPLLVTEYGCIERKDAEQKWSQYGKRVPSFTHFGNWAALALGHAGIPFKWNDGGWHGEMAARKNSKKVWNIVNYPVDNYAEISNIHRFIKGVPFDELAPVDMHVVNGDEMTIKIPGTKTAKFNAWGLVNYSKTLAVAWIYDREFKTNGHPFKSDHMLEVQLKANQTYEYKWFNTWTGKPLSESTGSGTLKARSDGVLLITLPSFPICTNPKHRKTVSGDSDGNDIAIWIRGLT